MPSSDSPVSTGSIQLDRILGGQGLPVGSMVEVFGNQGTGKTTLALELITSIQERGETAAFLDAEHSIDTDYAGRVGVQADEMLFSRPDDGEQALDICMKLVESNAVRLVVVDSAAALVPGNELEGGFDDGTGEAQSSMLAGALRKLSARIEQSGTVLIFTNQVRSRPERSVGPDETTPGGNALKFYADARIKLGLIDQIHRNNSVIGRRIEVDVKKNRTAPPDQSIELDLLFDRGICPYGDLLDEGRRQDLIEQTADGFTYGQNILGRDRDAVRERLHQDPSLCDTIRRKLDSSSPQEPQ